MERINDIIQRAKEIIKRIIAFLKRTINDRRFKRYAPLAIMVLVAILTLVTCVSGQIQKPQPDPEPDPPDVIETSPEVSPPVETPDPTPDPDPEPDPVDTGFRNPLTGLPTEEDISNKRPMAIVINNHRQANPQVGITSADIIYEYLVEGTTRMLAIYQDVSDVGVIGSVRSARHYTVDLAQSYDSIFIFAGYSPQANTVIKNRKIDHFDEVHGVGPEMYYRDSARRASMGSEHSLMTSGSKIMEHLPKYDLREEHDEGYECALSFSEDGTPEGGEKALEFTVRFGGEGKTTGFSYNDETRLYDLRQYGNAYIDGGNRQQVSVTNVLILKMAIAGIPGDTEGRLNITTMGTGEGYYACGGEYVEIQWSRENESAQFRYTLKDGSELVLGQGKTFICLIRTTGTVDFA